jgi:hypothetical protein
MRIGELTNIKGRWVSWDVPNSTGSIELLVTPKTVALEKNIQRRTVSSKMAKKGKIETKVNHELALKMLIEGCLKDVRAGGDGTLEKDDGTPWEFTTDSAFDLLWNGPSELGEFFEESIGDLAEESEEGNA